MFDHLIGNPLAKKYLQKLIDQQTIPHALLFAGPPGVGKTAFAHAFAEKLLGGKAGEGRHPDLHEYYPEGKIGAHSMETMRAFSEEVSLAPYQAPWKIFIIHEAERMLKYSANALLKTFEEPTPKTVIILISSAPEMLIPTILSRCRTLPFKAISPAEMIPWLQEKYQLAENEAQAVAYSSKGSLAIASGLAEQEGRLFDKYLSPILEKGGFSSYSELTRTARSLAEEIDVLKEETEPLPEGEMTAVQQNQWEKAQAGAGAVRHAQEAMHLFEELAAWYRDMQLLYYRGTAAPLWHSKYHEQIEQSLQKGHLLDLHLVLAAIQEASVSLQRSTPLQNVLETLFLRIKLL